MTHTVLGMWDKGDCIREMLFLRPLCIETAVCMIEYDNYSEGYEDRECRGWREIGPEGFVEEAGPDLRKAVKHRAH